MNYQIENFLKIMKYAINDSGQQELPHLQEPVDWNWLVELAKAHNLFAIFHEIAYQYPEYEQNTEYQKNSLVALKIVSDQVKRTSKFLELYRAFLAEDIQPIVMKGIVCRQLYGEHDEYRPSGDEDILVKKEDFHQVKSILERQGYSCENNDITNAQLNQAEHFSFSKPHGVTIEVHINLMGRRDDLRIQMGEKFQHVFEHSMIQEVQGVPISVMSHTEHFMYIVLHAFKHFIGTGVGLRQTLDIMMYQMRYENEIGWQEVEKVLTQCKANTYLGDIQDIGERYLGFDFSYKFPTACPEILLADMIDVGAFGKTDRADLIATNIISGALDQKTTGVATLLRAGFPTRKQMAEWTPYLNEKPWMLPVEWVRRWSRFIRRTKRYDGNLMTESYKRGQKRIKLLKKYGL